MRFVASLLAAACGISFLAGCTDHHAAKLTGHTVTTTEWKAVLNDWFDDGRIEGRYSCAAIVIATSHLPADQMTYGDALQVLERYTATVCIRPGDFDVIHVGMTDTDIAALSGAPQLPAYGCWYYPVTNKREGLRVCFKNGRASLVQRVVHL